MLYTNFGLVQMIILINSEVYCKDLISEDPTQRIDCSSKDCRFLCDCAVSPIPDTQIQLLKPCPPVASEIRRSLKPTTELRASKRDTYLYQTTEIDYYHTE